MSADKLNTLNTAELAPLNDETYDEAYAFNDRYDDATELLRENGAADLASEQVEAHGRVMSTAYAIAGCDPFARAIRGTVEVAKEMGVTDPALISKGVRRVVQEQLSKAPKTVDTEAEKK